MGCCLSRSTTTPPNPTPLHNDASRRRHPRPPPPPLQLEEETVKEVLTETPFTVLDAKPLTPDETIQAKEGVQVIEVKQQQHGNGIEDFKSRSVDVEVSEITVATGNRSAAAASVSESVSAATASAGGDEVMSKSRDRPEPLINRRLQHMSTSEQSPAKVSTRRPYSGELTVNGPREKRVRSPAKKAVPSPEKKTNLAPRPNRGRSQSPATSNNRNAAINAGPARIRRDAGELSGRRSWSPARNAFQCTSSSTSRTGPGSEINAVVNSSQSQLGEVRKTGTVEEDEGRRAADESLDNPLVSLECFIFL